MNRPHSTFIAFAVTFAAAGLLLAPVPAHAEHDPGDEPEHHWEDADDGTFGDGDNWLQGEAPIDGEFAIFNVTCAFTVDFGANHTNDRLLVRDGDVTFDLGGHEYDLKNDHLPFSPPSNPQNAEDVSLTVGAAAAGDRATLTLDGATPGSIVRGVQARIGQAAAGTDHEGGGTLNVRQSTLELGV